MSVEVFFITPPFTQLNTPYPATAYLKGFLNTKNISSVQADLGIEVISKLYSKKGFETIFSKVELINEVELSENSKRIFALREDFTSSIDSVMKFLKGKEPTLAHRIANGDFLPVSHRLRRDDVEWAFGALGTHDKATYLATLFLDDISDLIRECIDEHFGFSRYAERLGRSANSFDEIYSALQEDHSLIDMLTIEALENHLQNFIPKLIGISVPFPGNLFSAFRCAQWVKNKYPAVKIAMGGGFPNTELRTLRDPRVFEFFDFITLDDGEAPLENILKYIENKISPNELKRTFLIQENAVKYFDSSTCSDYKQSEYGTPDYTGLFPGEYFSVMEVMNPMHSLWSNGRWNKLTMAHGCYWGKCTFCDISLPYIQLYEPIAAALLCDRMEELIAQTGQSGFHFVDEAAPPALMRALALEIIRRHLVVAWWTNIRFEKNFTRDTCLLLKASGCIAVSGGLEVASDRLLALIQKGVTVEQVARVTKHFTDAGIMVHAYLMYGFPTQSAQETVDSLEVVRQLFENNLVQSGFWHRFAMTAHSPVGLNPKQFQVKAISVHTGDFANNDLEFTDEIAADPGLFDEGLRISLLNYMQGAGIDLPLQKWFDIKIPNTTLSPSYIKNIIRQNEFTILPESTRVIWLGKKPRIHLFEQTRKGIQYEMAAIELIGKNGSRTIKLNREKGIWLCGILSKLSVQDPQIHTLKEIAADYHQSGLEDFELFWNNPPVNELWKDGLMQL